MKPSITQDQFEPHVRIRKLIYRLSFWVLCLVLLYALVRNSDWTQTGQLLLEIPIGIILFCGAGWLLSFIFRAVRFQSEWKRHEKIRFADALQLTFIHNAAIVLVPFRIGELGYPVLVRRLIDVSWQQCIRSLLWLRFQDGVVLLGFAFFILPFLTIQIKLALAFLLFAMFLFSKKWWLKKLKSRQFLVSQLRSFLHQRSTSWGWLWSVLNWLSKISVVTIFLQSLTGLSTMRSLQGALTGELSALLPLSGPAGLGTYEAGVGVGLGLPWIDVKLLMASVLVSHLFFLCISLTGAGVALLWGSMRFKNFKSKSDISHA